MKKIFKKTWVKVIVVIAVFFGGLALVSKCQKVDAANFTLSDGTISKVTYNEGQALYYESTGFMPSKNYLYIFQGGNDQNSNYKIMQYSSGFSTITNYFSCTYENNSITCLKNQSANSTLILDGTYIFNIYYDYVNYDGTLYSLKFDLDEIHQNAYEEGKNSVDITTDNQEYTNQYIQDNNYHNHEEYLNYGDYKYYEGLNDGTDSVDITIDNQAYANQYIQDNNYHSNEEYLNYGNDQFQKGENIGFEKGKNSVDITTDNLEYVDQYIQDNNYHSNEEYLNYGFIKHNEGYNEANRLINTDSASYKYGFTIGQSSVDITTDNQEYTNQYIQDNNYHDHEEYLDYGSTKYNDGITYADSRVNEESASYTAAINSIDVTSNDAEVYRDAFLEGESQGYEKANKEGKLLGNFIPSLLGGFGSFFLTLLNIDILGFNLLSVIGIFITVLGIVVVIKFLKG